MRFSAVYKIVNIVTGDCYVGSSRNVKQRWARHKCPSAWKEQPNSQLYKDMQIYGVDKFRFQVLCPVEPEHLKEVEQELIEMIQPTYNTIRANGQDTEKYKEYQKKYFQSEKGKEAHKKYIKKYRQTEKGKEYHRKAIQRNKKYNNQLCFYNGETLTLTTLSTRFRRAGIKHPVLEAKKYLENKYER